MIYEHQETIVALIFSLYALSITSFKTIFPNVFIFNARLAHIQIFNPSIYDDFIDLHVCLLDGLDICYSFQEISINVKMKSNCSINAYRLIILIFSRWSVVLSITVNSLKDDIYFKEGTDNFLYNLEGILL